MRKQLIQAIEDGCTEEQAIERMTEDGFYYKTAAKRFLTHWGVEFPVLEDDTK